MDTSKVTLGFGEVVASGSERDFHRLKKMAGEAHIERFDIYRPTERRDRGSMLPRLRLCHLTDFQLCDPGSPTRFEFVNKLVGLASVEAFFPGHRSQELLGAYAIDAAVACVNELAENSPGGIDMCLITGDSVDNAQRNELELLVSLLGGGEFSLKDFFGPYFGVQSPMWGDEFYWHPDAIDDEPKARLGFPTIEGLIDAVGQTRSFGGLKVPWLISNGNHEVLIQGMARLSDEISELALGAAKAYGVDLPVESVYVQERFEREPHVLFALAEMREIAPNPLRRPLNSEAFVSTISSAPGEPAGHGMLDFDPANQTGLWFSHLDPLSRVLYLFVDTAKRGGGASGSLGAVQLAWIAATVESARQSTSDLVVIVNSHHGLDELDFSYPECASREEIFAVLESLPELRLWICGHTHENQVAAYPNPAMPGLGFFQITTTSLMDWPAMLREMEIYQHQDGALEIVSTLHHFGANLNPGELGPADLAGWHMNLAANSPYVGLGKGLEGSPLDRNVRMWLGPLRG